MWLATKFFFFSWGILVEGYLEVNELQGNMLLLQKLDILKIQTFKCASLTDWHRYFSSWYSATLQKTRIVRYRVIRKSQYMGKMVTLFTKPALYGQLYFDSIYGFFSPTHGELALAHLVLGAQKHL